MRQSVKLFPATVVFVLGCSHGKTTTPSPRQLAVLDASDGTPIWMGATGGRVLVATTHGDVGQAALSLIAIDPASGKQQQLAGSLPTGMPSLHAGALYVAGFMGEVGAVDLASGAYTKLVAVDGAARAVAVTDAGLVVGTTGHLELYDRSGAHHVIAGSDLGAVLDFDALVETRAGVFASSTLAGKVFKVDGEHAAVVADRQVAPSSLAATDTHVVWTTADGTNVGQHLVGIPIAGGPQVKLADAAPSAQILNVAGAPGEIACAMHGGANGEVMTVKPGGAPKLLASGPARLVAIDGGNVYWIEDAPKGWIVRTAPGA